MINQNPDGNGMSTTMPGGSRSRPALSSSQTDQSPDILCDAPAARGTTPASPAGRGSRVDWQMLALWIFVAASFAALLFMGYVIWTKCHGVSLF